VNPLDLLKDPSLVQSMTINEKLISSFQVAILGMVIVFGILYLLMLAIRIVKNICYSEQLDFAEERSDIQRKDIELETEIKREDEKIAAIIAAIMSREDVKKSSKFKIRKASKVEDNISVWGKFARGGKLTENSKGELL